MKEYYLMAINNGCDISMIYLREYYKNNMLQTIINNAILSINTHVTIMNITMYKN